MEIEAATGGTLNNRAYSKLSVDAVSTDSRSVPQGALFVPVMGKFFDGHNFIGEAFKKGAACVLSQKPADETKPVIFIKDTRRALLDLAAYYRSLFNVKVVAVTGSNGKTTTKDLIASVLSSRYNVLKTKGNLNNEIGLPLTVFELNKEHEIAVLEMGMSGRGEILNMSAVVKPDIAVITNIGVSHIETLGSREEILAAKLEVLTGMNDGGRVYLNGDDGMLRDAATGAFCRKFFGTNPEDDFYAGEITKRGISGAVFNVFGIAMESMRIETALPGLHMVYNSLAAAAVGADLGLSPKEIAGGIKLFRPAEMRMNISVNRNGAVIIDDTYNSSPASVRAALDVLAEAPGRKICILGDMLELGCSTENMHRETGRYAADLDIDKIICVGNLSINTYEGAFDEVKHGRSFSSAEYYPNKETLSKVFLSCIKEGDTVLIKASRGAKFEEISQKLLE